MYVSQMIIITGIDDRHGYKILDLDINDTSSKDCSIFFNVHITLK
jgi:hypothetical protein